MNAETFPGGVDIVRISLDETSSALAAVLSSPSSRCVVLSVNNPEAGYETHSLTMTATDARGLAYLLLQHARLADGMAR